MRTYPEDDDDRDEIARLKAEPWMVEMLRLNPEYVHWGPHEDYMWTKDGGWNSPVYVASWKEFSWQLDELNECVNFYFHIERSAKDCEACGGSGLNPATRELAENFYANHLPYNSPEWRATRWEDKLTPDELEMLTAERRSTTSHDAINRWLLIDHRAKRLGIYGTCDTCDEQGSIPTEDAGRLCLTLWILHPRKGCSRGVEIQRIERDDLSAVYAWLSGADDRNRSRFEAVRRQASAA